VPVGSLDPIGLKPARSGDLAGTSVVSQCARRVPRPDEKDLSQIVEVVLKENPENVKKYLAGNEKLFSFFVGEVMKKTQRKANPKVVNEILKEKLAKGEDKK
jgi:Asp-tRNA(Asn)/Glu-tRNA(Gln) amidotransferase B subunit